MRNWRYDSVLQYSPQTVEDMHSLMKRPLVFVLAVDAPLLKRYQNRQVEKYLEDKE